MNILTGIVMVIFLLFMIRGYRRGLIKSLASVISLVASLALVSFVTPYVAQFLEEQTSVYTYVMEKCQESFTVRLDEADTKMAETEAEEENITLKTEKNDGTVENTVSTAGSQIQKNAIEELHLPDILKNLLIRNNTEKVYKELAVNSFNDYVPKFMANLIMNIISFVVTWIIVASFIWLAVMTLDVIANLPIIHGVNQLLGLVLGAGQALVIVWIVFLAVTVLTGTAIGKSLMDMIEKSILLSKIYDGNIFLKLLQMR